MHRYFYDLKRKTMTAKEFLLKKINIEWEYDLRDVSYDNLEKLSKAMDEYANQVKNHGVSHHVSETKQCPRCVGRLIDYVCNNCGCKW